MARNENPPFPIGSTFYEGASIDTANYGGLQWEGTTWEEEDWNLTMFPASTAGARQARTNRRRVLMIVRNVSGITLLPKRLVTLQKAGTDGRFLLGRVDGYATTTAQEGFPVDEWLPATGVVNGDLFYIVIAGPATCLTDLASGAGSVITVGDVLVSLTAATSGATTAGRVAVQDITGATTPLALQLQNTLGRALSAKTTTQTNGDVLVDIRNKMFAP